MPLEVSSIKVEGLDGLDEGLLRIDVILSSGVEIGSMCVFDKTSPDYLKLKDEGKGKVFLISHCVKDLVKSVLNLTTTDK